MPREQLLGLATDVDRLLDAGATASSGNENLQRRSRALRELGKKVAALNPVADAVDKVTQATGKQTGSAFLDLVAMMRQVRASLSGSGLTGDLKPAVTSGPWATPRSVRDLNPLYEALAKSGSHREETIKSAVERGAIGDMRLLPAMLDALSDQYPPVAELVAETVLPSLGNAVLPDLQATFDLNGKIADVRRLHTICRIDKKLGTELCRRAVKEGNVALRAKGLELLTNLIPAAEVEKVALEFVKDKSREVRVAALSALRVGRSDEALDTLVVALSSDDFQEAIDSLAKFAHPQTTGRLVRELAAAATESAIPPARKGKKGTATPTAKPAPRGAEKAVTPEDRAIRFTSVLERRSDRRATPGLLELLSHSVLNLREQAAQALIAIGDPEGLAPLADLIEDKHLWREAIRAAWQLPPKERYERLAPLCSPLSDKKQGAREKAEFLLEQFSDEAETGKPRTDWDPRWAKDLLPHLDCSVGDDVGVALEVVQGQKAVPHLLRILVATVDKDKCGVVEALGRLRVKEAIPTFLKLMPTQKPYHYCIHDALRLFGDRSVLPALREMLEKRTKDWQRKYQLERLIEDLEKLPADGA